MDESVDHEIEAIKRVLEALTPLSERARISVIEYAAKRLDLSTFQFEKAPRGGSGTEPIKESDTSGRPLHIKAFKEQKQPRSANEMAALVAYYLANLAPSNQRKETVNQKDIETQFKIAEFPLPRQVRATLPNAKNAGYFDLVGDGEYKLNAVGHNLVAHSMPRPKIQKAKGRSGKKKQANQKAERS